MRPIKRTIVEDDIPTFGVLYSDDQKHRTIYLSDLEITMDKKTYDIFVTFCVEKNSLEWLWEHRNEGHPNLFQAWREEINSVANQVKRITKRMEEVVDEVEKWRIQDNKSITT